MIRLTLHIAYARRTLTVCACALVCLLVAGLVLVPARPTQAQPGPQTTYVPEAGARHVYVTSATYYPDQALSACGTGYHMASMWEILDVSNLVYDSDHPAAKTRADSGFGPPTDWYGFVRTGYSKSALATPGSGNCTVWTSRLSYRHGTAVSLAHDWVGAPGDLLTWDAIVFTCDSVGPVWCVSDIAPLYPPPVYVPVQLRIP